MGNVQTTGYPLFYVNLNKPEQSGITTSSTTTSCTGYPYVKESITSCICQTGYTGFVKSYKPPNSASFSPTGCSLSSGNTNYTITSLSIPPSTNSSIGSFGNVSALYLPNESNVTTGTKGSNQLLISNYSISSVVTVSCWVNFTQGINSFGTIFEFGTETVEYFQILASPGSNSSTVNIYSWAGANGTPVPININTWNHVAAIWTPGTSLAFYVNGNLQWTVSTYIKNALAGGIIVLGENCKTSLIRPFVGYIGDFRLYGRALTATEITTLANSNVVYPTISNSNLLIQLLLNGNFNDYSTNRITVSQIGTVRYVKRIYSSSSFSLFNSAPQVITNALVSSNNPDYFNILTNSGTTSLYQNYINLGYIDTSMFFCTSAKVSFKLSSTLTTTDYYVGLIFASSQTNIFKFFNNPIPINSTFLLDTTQNFIWPYDFNNGQIYNVYFTIISTSDLSNLTISNLNFAFNGPICSDFTGFANNFGYNGACICDKGYSPIASAQTSPQFSGSGTNGIGSSSFSQNGSIIYYYNNTTTPTQISISGCYGDNLLCPPGFYCPSGPFALNSAIKCPTGSYCKIGSTGYTVCPSGYYCPYGSSVYTMCSGGTYCPQGSSVPMNCSSGYYCPQNTGSQTPCAPGYYSASGASICTPCYPGYYTLGSNGAQTSCQPSPSGYYVSGYGSSQSGSNSILNSCIIGYYCPSSSTTGTSYPCPSGYLCSPATTGPVCDVNYIGTANFNNGGFSGCSLSPNMPSVSQTLTYGLNYNPTTRTYSGNNSQSIKISNPLSSPFSFRTINLNNFQVSFTLNVSTSVSIMYVGFSLSTSPNTFLTINTYQTDTQSQVISININQLYLSRIIPTTNYPSISTYSNPQNLTFSFQQTTIPSNAYLLMTLFYDSTQSVTSANSRPNYTFRFSSNFT